MANPEALPISTALEIMRMNDKLLLAIRIAIKALEKAKDQESLLLITSLLEGTKEAREK